MVEPYPSEKYDFVSWDDYYSQLNGTTKIMFQTTNQLGHVLLRGTEDGMIDQHVKTESDRIRVQVHIPLSLFGWLVVLTILKKNSQWEGLSHILWKKTV